MSSKAWFGGAMGSGSYRARAVTFDGTNDYLEKSSDFTGNADGKEGTFSFWINIKNNTRDFIVFSSNDNVQIRYLGSASGGVIRITLLGTQNQQVVLIQNVTRITVASGWNHVLCSWNASTTTGHMYINDVNDADSSSLVNNPVDYTENDFVFGANTGFADKMEADISDFYFNSAEFIDLSVTANRRKFISADVKPVFLGADGSLPTGTAPILFLSLAQGGAVSSFATNKGTGGGMTITGTLTEAGTSPSD